MYDIGKAFIMAVNTIMFIMAATISILLYHNIDTHIKGVMLASDYSNRGDSIVGNNEESSKRRVPASEIIISILNLKDTAYDNCDSNDKIYVNNNAFKYNTDTEEIVINTAAGDVEYSINGVGLRDYFRNNIRGHEYILVSTYDGLRYKSY